MAKPVLDGHEFEFFCCDHIREDKSEKGATGFVFTEKSQFTAGTPAYIETPLLQIGEWKMLVLCPNCYARFENEILKSLFERAAKSYFRNFVVKVNQDETPAGN